MVKKYRMTYEFSKEQRKTLNDLIKGELSFRGAKSFLDVSSSGVYTMLSNYIKQLFIEGKVDIK